MKPPRIVLGAAVAVVLLVSAFLLLRDVGDGKPVRERLVVAPTVVQKSRLVDAQGALIEEFSGDCAGSGHPWLCGRVQDELRAADEHLLTRGGLTIKTTIDPRMQGAAQQAIDHYVSRDDPQVATQAMIVPGTGEIRAMATSRTPGDARGLQQGTTAMAYALAAALESGMRYDDGFPYSDAYRAPTYSAFKNCAGEAVGDPAHSVVNRKQDHGEFTTLRSGVWAGEETFFLKVTEKVGLCETVNMARRLGLGRADGAPLVVYETFALGVNEVDPVSVAGTYATFAARGKHCAPHAVTEVRDGSGLVRAFPPRCEQVLDPHVADAVTGVLSGAPARSPLKGLGRDAAGMDGTTDNYVAAWYAGYTPDLASAVSLGADLRNVMTDVTIGGRHYANVHGTSIPGPIWKTSMTAALKETAETAFVPSDAVRFGGCRDACAK
ncbi:hypothetical protein ACFLIM_14505 [Nonomuraea sp. M3C6]|uniref:Penicillin binding protein transpeptidase domain-containing protein n=1 Tax=Nonomuraea marmarensis TaxID=3351344 RepID=A0ABW7ABA4_9ACTN